MFVYFTEPNFVLSFLSRFHNLFSFPKISLFPIVVELIYLKTSCVPSFSIDNFIFRFQYSLTYWIHSFIVHGQEYEGHLRFIMHSSVI